LVDVCGYPYTEIERTVRESVPSPKDIQKRIKRIVREKGRLRQTGTYDKHAATLDSAMAKAESDAGEDLEDDNAGMIDGFVWHANHLSGVPICDRCLARDKKWYPNGSQRPQLHKWCRCYVLAKAKTPEELGMGAVPGPISARPYAEWANEKGVQYDGGLARLPMSKSGRVSRPRPERAKVQQIDRSAMAKARKAAYDKARRARIAAKKAWDTGVRYGQESRAGKTNLVE